jgi:hypothetical protein
MEIEAKTIVSAYQVAVADMLQPCISALRADKAAPSSKALA